ncbi:MAG: hypothetical protein Q9170_008096 [Blastenia crenularia]
MYFVHTTFLLLVHLCTICSSHPFYKRGISDGPVIASNFADPAFIQVNETYYAFSTTSDHKNVPIATSTDFNNWAIADIDAFPTSNFPSWTTGGIWAPDVVQLPGGTFVLYYSGTSKDDTSKHCVGAATSPSVTGPYVSSSGEPLACDLK